MARVRRRRLGLNSDITADKLFESIEERANRGVSHGHTYYWIWCVKDGKLIVVGCKTSEQEAYQFGYSKLSDTDFRIEPLPTRDMNSAVRMLKGKLLDKTANLDMSIKRAKRKV